MCEWSHRFENFGVLGQAFAQISDDAVFRYPDDGTADDLDAEDGSNGSVCFAHGFLFIHQEREGEVMGRGEGSVRSAIGVVDSEDLQAKVTEILPLVTDGAKLDRAARRTVTRVKE